MCVCVCVCVCVCTCSGATLCHRGLAPALSTGRLPGFQRNSVRTKTKKPGKRSTTEPTTGRNCKKTPVWPEITRADQESIKVHGCLSSACRHHRWRFRPNGNGAHFPVSADELSTCSDTISTCWGAAAASVGGGGDGRENGADAAGAGRRTDALDVGYVHPATHFTHPHTRWLPSFGTAVKEKIFRYRGAGGEGSLLFIMQMRWLPPERNSSEKTAVEWSFWALQGRWRSVYRVFDWFGV